MPAPHPPEFRQRAIELARQKGRPVAQVAKSLGISESCLRNWMAQARRPTRVGEMGSPATSVSGWRCCVRRTGAWTRHTWETDLTCADGGIMVIDGCWPLAHRGE
jgi:transposase-like protein